MNSRIRSLLRALALGAFASIAPFAFAQNIWIGAGGTNLWSDGTNWTNGVPPVPAEDLVFTGASQVANVNDTTANTQYGNITFDAGSDPFVITGTALNIGANITNNEATNAQTLGLPLNFVANTEISVVTGGNLVLQPSLTALGGFTGTGVTITKTGDGTLTLSGGNSGLNTFNGTYDFRGGLINIASNNAIGVSTMIFNGSTVANLNGGNNTSGNITLMNSVTFLFSGNTNFNVLTSGTANLTTTSPANSLTFDLNGAAANTQLSITNGNANTLALFDGTLAFADGSAGSVRFGTGGSGLASGNVSMTLDMGTATTRIYGRNNNMSLTVGTFNGTAANLSSNNITAIFTYHIGGNASAQTNTDSNFGGIVTNRGGIAKWGTGTLTISGVASTTTGSFVVHGGTMAVAKLSDIGVASSIGQGADPTNLAFNGGTLRYTGTGDSTNKLFAVTANGGTIESAGSGAVNFTNATALTFNGTGNRTLTLTGSSNGSLASIIPDVVAITDLTSVTKSGTGTWTLSGVSTYTGVTLVSAGTLIVDGAIVSDSSVLEDATIGGSGSFGAISTVGSNGGGQISPGNSIGTMTATSLTWGGSSDGTSPTLFAELGTGNASDSILLSGALTKGAGTDWIIDFMNTGANGNFYTLISYASTDFTQLDVTNGDLSFINLAPGVIIQDLVVGVNAITFSTVPEPSTWALILGGAGLGLAALRRRRAVR